MLPVIIFTLLYNLPKFFEIYVNEEMVTKTLNCSDILSDTFYQELHANCTLNESGNITLPDKDSEDNVR